MIKQQRKQSYENRIEKDDPKTSFVEEFGTNQNHKENDTINTLTVNDVIITTEEQAYISMTSLAQLQK